MRGAVPCLSADLTTYAVPLHTLQDLKVGGGVRVSVVAQERREVRECEGFHRRALPVCGSDSPRRTTKGGRQLAKGGHQLAKGRRQLAKGGRQRKVGVSKRWALAKGGRQRKVGAG